MPDVVENAIKPSMRLRDPNDAHARLDVVENAVKPSMRIIRVSKARDERQAPMFFCPSNRSRRRELEMRAFNAVITLD